MAYMFNSDSSKLSAAPYIPIDYQYTPKLNGGLYVGEPFKKDAPWGNFPIKPETGSLINKNLKSANPPPLAQYHYPGAEHRPGNNTPELPGIVQCGDYGFYAINDDRVFSKDCLTYCALSPQTPQC
jgi:hypothetical protein